VAGRGGVGGTPRPVRKPKGTSIGNGNFKTASLNKKKKASFKRYRGQGR